MIKQYNFECSLECKGKCCFGVTYIEKESIMFFSDKVPIFFDVRYFLNNYLKQYKKYKTFVNLIKNSAVKITDGKTILYLITDIIIGSKKQNDKCYFLTNEGLCSIHNNKPLKCKLLPLQPFIPIEKMDFAFNQMKENCIGFNNNSKILWKNKKIYNKEFKQYYFEYFKKLQDLKPITEILFEKALKHNFSLLDNIFDNKEGVGTIFLPFPPFDEVFYKLNIKNKEKFIINQISAIENYFKIYPNTKNDKILSIQLENFKNALNCFNKKK